MIGTVVMVMVMVMVMACEGLETTWLRIAGFIRGYASDVVRVLEVVSLLRLNWKDKFGDMSRIRLLPRLENLPGLTDLRKTTCQGGFSFKILITPSYRKISIPHKLSKEKWKTKQTQYPHS